MTLLELTLSIALALSLSVAVWLWRRGQRLSAMPPLLPIVPQSCAEPEVQSFAMDADLAALDQPLFQAAAATLDAGMVVVDAQHVVRFLNPEAETLLDLSATMRGQSLIAVLRDHQVDALVAEVLRDGESRELALQPIRSGRTLRLRCTPLRIAERIVAVLLIIRDFTQISMLERARRDLVANVSHELRTPLASLKLLIETVQSAPPPDVAQRMLGQMAHEIDAVTQLVDELHELSQIESGRVTLKLAPLPIQPVIERALERIKPQADRKAITVTAEVLPDLAPVLMDPDRIGQVLLNLLHNAIKFTATGGQVTVCATCSTDSSIGPWLQVSVSDTGIGIPAKDLPRIFERFYKVDRSRTRHAGGTGLGLAIAKHLIEGHGGRLWADSTEGHGSTFKFTLPLA
ncbi:sensor histidine kinase [Candidatus Viridilinea mediisalina]|uniref:histidine kinase n=1 Tax=Candidatus Viridilinea mediisalina TaxID=2024553 RepID=A0A2A6RE35_9CHLR|nr:ATP-binding protein [Candidatus Viridilinea mediisalina]PDW00305.1 PAS domain-containing sensor histidine kinase [Candidatus Viridilinea mediisalina]